MSGELKFLGQRELFVFFWLILLISTLITWNSIGPSAYGASSRNMQAGEIEVMWWQALTGSDDTLMIKYDAELGPIEIFVVSQSSYNRTSGELPTSYFLHHSGNSTELYLDGPLPVLYFVVISEIDQYLYKQSWIYSSPAKMARVLAYPVTGLLIVVTGIYLGWYWKMSKENAPHLQ